MALPAGTTRECYGLCLRRRVANTVHGGGLRKPGVLVRQGSAHGADEPALAGQFPVGCMDLRPEASFGYGDTSPFLVPQGLV